MKQTTMALVALALGCLLAACATSGTANGVAESGFLGDYTQLQPGEDGQAQLRYLAPDAQFGKYDKILLDPVKVYATGKSNGLDQIPTEEMQKIINFLDAAVQTQLVSDYALVREPGPGTMRLRIAITEARGANIPLNLRSTGLPGDPGGGPLQKMTESGPGVSRAAVEMELLDSQSGKRLMAVVDARTETGEAGFNKWEGVAKAYWFWALKLKQQLAELRAK